MRLLFALLLLCSCKAFAFTEEEVVSQTVDGALPTCAQKDGKYFSVTKEKGVYLSTSSLIKKLKVRISRIKSTGRKARFQKKLSSLKRAYAKAKPFCRSLNPLPTPAPTRSPTVAPTATRREEIHPYCRAYAYYSACYQKKDGVGCQQNLSFGDGWGYTKEEARVKAMAKCEKALKFDLAYERDNLSADPVEVIKPCSITLCRLNYVYME